MILPDFIIPSCINVKELHSGLDTLSECLDKKHFKNYPYSVEYEYNSRGYRDDEWPDSLETLQRSIWCVGDSFTLGLGSPRSHTWTHILQHCSGTRTINVSMNGASNDWIARKSQRILEVVQPKFLILHWSYISRREQSLDQPRQQSWQRFYQQICDPDWPQCDWDKIDQLPQDILYEINNVHGGWDKDKIPDELRKIFTTNSTDEEDVAHTIACLESLNQYQKSSKIIHSFIPSFAPTKELGRLVYDQLTGPVVPEFKKLDLARDGHHYDIKTSQAFVQQLMQFLN